MSAPDNPLAAAQEPTRDQIRAHLDIILKSPPFRHAELNRTLLGFLTTWMLDRAGQHLKENEIAVSVFHRQAESFDPQSDSVVRVQMARLRAKLHEYYEKHGAPDAVRFEIPKGSYHLVASLLPVALDSQPAAAPEAPATWLERVRHGWTSSRRSLAWALAAIVLMAVGALLRQQQVPLTVYWSP
jgi:hypothetical protein